MRDGGRAALYGVKGRANIISRIQSRETLLFQKVAKEIAMPILPLSVAWTIVNIRLVHEITVSVFSKAEMRVTVDTDDYDCSQRAKPLRVEHVCDFLQYSDVSCTFRFAPKRRWIR